MQKHIKGGALIGALLGGATLVALGCADGSGARTTGVDAAVADSTMNAISWWRPQNSVATVRVAVSAPQVAVGQTVQATATAYDSRGRVVTGHTATWSTSNTALATTTSSGLVRGIAAGSVQVRATESGVTGSASVTVTSSSGTPSATQLALVTAPSTTTTSGAVLSPAPVVQLRSASGTAVAHGGVVVTAAVASGTATLSGTPTATTSASGAATFTNLVLSGSGSTTLRFTSSGLTTATSGPIAVTASSGGSTGAATLLFEEHFDDTNLGGRGWYDLPSGGVTSISTAEHIPGSTGSLQMTFNQGGTSPSPKTAARHLFTPSNSVYLRFWVKHSTNWIGSGQNYHPHLFHFITTEDDQYVGPATTHLTAYIEENYQSAGSYASMSTQDALNIDQSRINQDLTNVTESRGVSGCNGNTDGYATSCYINGGAYDNEKIWRSTSPVFLPNPGAGYKGDWHEVEAYLQLNSIVGGKGQTDGVAQYWVDGQLVIDHHNVLFRTGAHPNMKFNQFLMAPFIGDGSPATQTLWIDDLAVMTARPN